MVFGRKKKDKDAGEDPLAANLAALGLDPSIAAVGAAGADDDAAAQAELDAIMAGGGGLAPATKGSSKKDNAGFDLAAIKSSIGSLSTAEMDLSGMHVSDAGAPPFVRFAATMALTRPQTWPTPSSSPSSPRSAETRPSPSPRSRPRPAPWSRPPPPPSCAARARARRGWD